MDKTKKNEIIAVFLFALSLFLFLSLFTFTKDDLSFYTSSPNDPFHNITGVVGVYIGGILTFFVGKASYVLPLVILVWGISYLFQIESKKVVFKILGTLILLIAVASFLGILGGLDTDLAFENSGLIGSVISSFLLEYLGRVGTIVFLLTMVILSILIATEFMVLPIALAAYKFTSSLIKRFGPPLLERMQGLALKMRRGAKTNLRTSKEEVSRKLESIKKQVEEIKKTSFTRKAEKRIKIVEPPIQKKSEPEMALGYSLPSLDLLKASSETDAREKEDDLKKKALLLEKTLLEFEVEAKVTKINRGPVVTMFELEPSVGTKISKITSLSDNISLAMKSRDLRIVAPLPGKGTIGVEVPNEKSELVLLKEVIESQEYKEETSFLKLALGKDVQGMPMIADLAKMPHLLIAGATGSGKTVCLNSIISSFLFNASPEDLKFLMIDPKRVELMIFEGIPHLASPIITNSKAAAASLNWVVSEMEKRYELFAQKGVRNIEMYKEKRKEEELDLPYIIVVVDELADLIMIAQRDVEGAIMRIAQLSRAAGIHMIIATQRPSVNVVTGVIKANFPARISFKVASKVDSRTILDANGAEKLLGKGDMLLMEPGETSLVRGQCSFIDDSEIRSLVRFVKSQTSPNYIMEVAKRDQTRLGDIRDEKDELYDEAVRVVIETKQASASMLQRRLRVGYSRAARMIDIMEAEGIVGPPSGAKPRQILVESIDQLKAIHE